MMVVGVTQMNDGYINETSFDTCLPSVHASSIQSVVRCYASYSSSR